MCYTYKDGTQRSFKLSQKLHKRHGYYKKETKIQIGKQKFTKANIEK